MPIPAPRNHARRVEDLQALHDQGLLTFRESSRPPRVYVVEVAGERHELPARGVDLWLLGWRLGAAAADSRKPRPRRKPTGQNRTLTTAEDA